MGVLLIKGSKQIYPFLYKKVMIHSKCFFCFFQMWFAWIISRDKHFLTSVEYSGLDLSLARLAFEKIAKKTKVLLEVNIFLTTQSF